MRNQNLLMTLILGFALVGCVSAHSDNGYPVLKPISDKLYVWDDKYSEALNVALMAQPAGVGNGLRDYDDGTQAKSPRVSDFEQLLSVGFSLATGSYMDATTSASMNNQTNNLLNWQPSTIDLVDLNTISENGQVSFLKLRSIITEKHKAAISEDFQELIWGDTLTYKNANNKPKGTNASIAIKSTECSDIRRLMYPANTTVTPFVSVQTSKYFVDGTDFVEELCWYSLNITVAGYFVVDNVKMAIVVSRINQGYYLLDTVIINYKGYVLVPDMVLVNPTTHKDYNYAFVAKNGEKLLFEKNQ